MTNLRSHHPDLQLSDHISQVMEAVEGLYQWHSSDVMSQDIKKLVQKAALLHDTGKATEAFQEYIKNPLNYVGDPRKKAHTPMSVLITLLLSKKEIWNILETVLLSAVVFGHHGELPSVEKLREIGSGPIAQILKIQCETLIINSLTQHCDIDISITDFNNRPWAKMQQYLDRSILPTFENLEISEAIKFRLKTQLIFSLLLEADKAFLAVKDSKHYLNREKRFWKSEWIEERIGNPEESSINSIRKSIRHKLNRKIKEVHIPDIYSLTAPTGSGKTLLSATWLFKLREEISKKGTCPKAIIVLPFLSIIDQTAKEYKNLLTFSGEEVDGTWFLTSHSLSDRKYKLGFEEETEHFFIDTWRTEMVITTYDQFLLSLMDPRARYQMRFHNLCDSLIVMDEVQSLPCKLWEPLEVILKSLKEIGNSNILLMSATLPAIIPTAKPILEDFEAYFKKLNRYRLEFRLKENLNINDFCKEVSSRKDQWIKEKKRVLITLNTRKSARFVRDNLAKNWPEKFSRYPLFFLSADVTPKDRLSVIENIKEGSPCIVVSTQCIEAGVDIDMDFIIRDFAPFDSLIQIAGRCNRNGKMSNLAVVEVVDLVNDQGKRYADMIYDDVHLQVTRQLVEKNIEEKDILSLSTKYFESLSNKKNTGLKHLKRFARWEEDENVRELLRGKEREKYSFLVIEQDSELKSEMRRANDIENRWQRREAWRSIAGRIANITVNIYAKQGFSPQSIASKYLNHWILYEGYYSSDRGLVLPSDFKDEVLIL